MVALLARKAIQATSAAPVLALSVASAVQNFSEFDDFHDGPYGRHKRAAKKHKSGSDYDYTDELGKLDSDDWANITFGVCVVTSFVLMVILIYTSIFGRRMVNNGLRWHTIYVSVFMLINLFIYVDISEKSPWQDYLRNVYITKHSKAIQWVTLTAFPASLTIMVPFYLAGYACQSMRDNVFTRWILWVAIYGGLAAFNGFLGLKYSLKGDGEIPTDPWLGVYQFWISVASYVTLIYLLLFACVAAAFFVCYAVLNTKNQHGGIAQRFADLIQLFLLWFYAVVCTVFVAPQNSMNSVDYVLLKVLPEVTELLEQFQSSSSNSTSGSDSTSSSGFDVTTLLQYADLFQSAAKFVLVSELYMPLAFYVATSIFIGMYRESLLNLLSCGACYRSDKSGSLWGMIPNRFRSIYPLEALRWANPAFVAQGIVPPPPGHVDLSKSPLAHVSLSDKKELMVEQLE